MQVWQNLIFAQLHVLTVWCCFATFGKGRLNYFILKKNYFLLRQPSLYTFVKLAKLTSTIFILAQTCQTC